MPYATNTTPHQNLKRTHAHVVTPSSWLCFEPCFRHSPPNQIILWVHGSENSDELERERVGARPRLPSLLYGCSEALKTTRRKKGTAFHDGVGCFFSSDRRASKDANSQVSQHLNTKIVRFCLFNNVVCACFFLLFGRMPLSFLCEFCGRVGNEMPRRI